jgi:hypothetical protein
MVPFKYYYAFEFEELLENHQFKAIILTITEFFGLSRNYKTQRFGNCICFHPQERGETPTLLGPLERANLKPQLLKIL